MEGDRPVTLIEPGDPDVRHSAWAQRVDRGGGETVQAETQVGSWTIRWRIRQVGLANLDHTWQLLDENSQEHDVEALRDIKKMWWDLYTIART